MLDKVIMYFIQIKKHGRLDIIRVLKDETIIILYFYVMKKNVIIEVC